MIPVKLTIKNFMPYRGQQPAFSFEHLHVACISGDNGAGKSSIIDAITWAIWGKSRATSEDDVITQGETEAAVALEFRAGDQLFLVERRRVRSKKASTAGTAALHFYIKDHDSLTVCDGDSIRSTEAKIVDVLKMDYDTFINSAYLKQGESDSFSKAQPIKRREILTRIMNLDYWSKLQESAKAKLRDVGNEHSVLARGIEDATAMLATRAEVTNALQEAEKEKAAVSQAKCLHQSVVDSLKKSVQLLDARRERLATVGRELSQLDLEKRKNLAEKETAEARFREYTEVVSHKEEVEKGFAECESIKASVEAVNRKLAELNYLRDERKKPEEIIALAEKRLNDQLASWKGKFEELERQAASIDSVRVEIEKTASVLRRLEALSNKLDIEKESVKTRETHLAEISALRGQLFKEIQDITEKLKLLHDERGANCPVCHADLGGAKLAEVVAAYQADKNTKLSRVTELEIELKSEAAALRSSEEGLKLQSKELEANLRQAQAKERLLEMQLKEALEAEQRIIEGRKKIAELEHTIGAGCFAEPQKRELAEIDSKIASLAYREEERQRLVSELEKLKNFEPAKHRLDNAEKLIEMALETEKLATGRLSDIEAKEDERRGELQILEKDLLGLPQMAEDLKQAEMRLSGAAAAETALSEKIGSLREKNKQLDELQSRLASDEKLLANATEKEGIYGQLVEAFGKKGVPGMLIEQAIPEIVSEADRLLSLMTDNRMHIKLDLQPQNRKGDIQESFDILIADEIGTRNYQMYSGGEAFRIDLALRIAISRLIAGTGLTTLIIDEGFGTQDAEGLEHVIGAIQSIQNEFKLILVITHIEEFKDVFPNRIDIFKGPEGSTISAS